jgi:serine/threonine protein kinase
MATTTCPRCFNEIDAGADVKFCPKCGLPDVVKAANDVEPVLLTVENRSYRVTDRFALGSLASLYHCEILHHSPQISAVFKIARDARSNLYLANEARVLRQLATAVDSASFIPFIPEVVDSFTQGGSDHEPARQANVLAYHPDIKSPDLLYTLEEVRAAYPGGLDQKDVAWIWRRLLNVLSFCHRTGVAHCAVLPGHVLIEPEDHKLVLIDWCFATTRDRWSVAPSSAGTGMLARWFMRDGIPRPAIPVLDISLAAQCMIYLMKGDAEHLPPEVDPAIRRHFVRCVDLPDHSHSRAEDLLGQFDRLIEALWGPRQFRPLTLPKRR